VSTDQDSGLLVTTAASGETTVLTVLGILDSTTYIVLRDHIIEAALDEPRAVIVDFSALSVPAESALAVFTSARWHVQRWPEVPIVLVCGHSTGREALARHGVDRSLPVFSTVEEALSVTASRDAPPRRRRVSAALPTGPPSLTRSRELVAEWLTNWALSEMIPVVKVIVTVLVENVLHHTESRADLRVETNGTELTVAVVDASRACPNPREQPSAPSSGLHIVTALSRVWGTAPTPAGKTVWAVLGPENQL
jgi:anti-anti-sigma regulatory factor